MPNFDNAQPVRLLVDKEVGAGLTPDWMGVDNPVPVAIVQQGLGASAPVTGSFTNASNNPSDVFIALPGRKVRVRLSGTFSGTIRAERCHDGTLATAQIITAAGGQWAQFSGPAQEAIESEDEAGVGYILRSAIASGTCNYRLGHK